MDVGKFNDNEENINTAYTTESRRPIECIWTCRCCGFYDGDKCGDVVIQNSCATTATTTTTASRRRRKNGSAVKGSDDDDDDESADKHSTSSNLQGDIDAVGVNCSCDCYDGTFRVTRSRGKTLGSGGFGYYHDYSATTTTTTSHPPSTTTTNNNNVTTNNAKTTTTSTSTCHAPASALVVADVGKQNSPSLLVVSVPTISSQHNVSELLEPQNGSTIDDKSASDAPTRNTDHSQDPSTTATMRTETTVAQDHRHQQQQEQPCYYLFLEEVVYLYERGLLNVTNIPHPNIFLYELLCKSPTMTNYNRNDDDNMENDDIEYNKKLRKVLPLEKTNGSKDQIHSNTSAPISPLLSMPAYLVYQHLRCQTFRVVRHTVTRRNIIQQMQSRRHQLLQLQKNQITVSDDDNKNNPHNCGRNDESGEDHCSTVASSTGDRISDDVVASYRRKEMLADDDEDGTIRASTRARGDDDDDNTERLVTHPRTTLPCVDHNDNDNADKRLLDINNALLMATTTSATSGMTIGKRPRSENNPTPSIGGTASTTKKKRNLWRTDAGLQSLRRDLRWDAAHAPSPCVYPVPKRRTIDSCPFEWEEPTIAFDCYNPGPTFASACPGVPDFHVAITYYNHPGSPCKRDNDDVNDAMHTTPQLTFQKIQQLIRQSTMTIETDPQYETTPIPLKIATVSDSGTVIMFGVTDYGVPTIPTTGALT